MVGWLFAASIYFLMFSYLFMYLYFLLFSYLCVVGWLFATHIYSCLFSYLCVVGWLFATYYFYLCSVTCAWLAGVCLVLIVLVYSYL